MRELARDWMTSFVSFARGHGGGGRASTSVGAAFMIAALLLALVGLRWINAGGDSEEASDNTPWSYDETGDVGPTTTVPASSPAKVVPVKDPDPDGDDPEATPTESTKGKDGVFLPGFSPTPGGGTGPPTTGSTPPTTKGTGSTTPTTGPTSSNPTSTGPTSTETTSTTEATTTTSEDPTTTSTSDPPPPGEEGLVDPQAADVKVNELLDAMGWPFA